MNSPMSRLLRGELTSAELPEHINLGDLNATMNELWEWSIRDIDKGMVTEWGGVLILDAEGNLNKKMWEIDDSSLAVCRRTGSGDPGCPYIVVSSGPLTRYVASLTIESAFSDKLLADE